MGVRESLLPAQNCQSSLRWYLLQGNRPLFRDTVPLLRCYITDIENLSSTRVYGGKGDSHGSVPSPFPPLPQVST